MRASPLIALMLSLPLILQAQEAKHADNDADHAVAGGGTLPAGWTARADDNADLANVKVAPMGGGIHVTLGPAIILYKPSTAGKGPFHTLATFTLTKPTKHREGYGLFAGGRDLEGGAQSYVYFLIGQDGTYLIKRRDGKKTTDLSKGWVANPAVNKADGKGASTNKLEIDNKSDPSKIEFLVNGKSVYSTDPKTLNLDGIVGLRVNHNLDVHVEGFDVHR
ncbi:MAG TPA: hypothetical protein VIG08_16325 [Gemmatimonadales bacterium]|jgi:hypothetical protein